MKENGVYTFGSFQLDARERLLLRDGQPVELTPKAFNTLLILVQNSGHLLTKRELMSKVWPDSHVEEPNLTVTIGMLRKALGEENGTRYIETVPRQGYRFTTPVRQLIEEDKTQAATLSKKILRKMARAGAVIFGFAALLATYYVIRTAGHRNEDQASVMPSHRVAVLPFKNLSGDAADGWISTAFSEWLTAELQAGGDLSVIPGENVAYMSRDLSLPPDDTYSRENLSRIRKNLSADLLVLGSFAVSGEKTDQKLRVDVRIVNAATGETLGSRTETTGKARLLDSVANLGSQLREELRLSRLSPVQVTEARHLVPKDSAVGQLYIEAVEKLRQFDPQGASQLLEKAIRAEPDYAMAHASLATAWSTLGYEIKAREEAGKATALASGLPREQSLWIAATYRALERDWDKALQLYSALCALDPENIRYGIELARVQSSAGKPADALLTLRKLRTLAHSDDPSIDLAEAGVEETLGDFPAEQAAADRALIAGKKREVQSLMAQALLRKGWALNNMGKTVDAIKVDREAQQIADSIGDRNHVGWALKNIADVLDDEGKLADSIATYQQALQVFREIGSQSGIAVSLNNMANALKDQGKLSEAKDAFVEEIRICRMTGDHGREALSLGGLASIFWREDDLKAALNLYEQALAEHKENNDKSHMATVLGNIALALEDQGEFLEARKKLEESLSLYHETGSTPQVARTLMNIGEALFRNADLSGAQTKFEEALQLGRQTNNNSIIGYALLDLGEVAAERGDLSEAMKRNEDALSLRLQMGEMGMVAESRFYISDLEVEQGHFAAAEALARQAVEQFEKEGEIDQKASALALLSEALFLQGKHEEAKSAIERALQISSKIEDKPLQMFIARKAAAVSVGSVMSVESLRRLNAVIAQSRKYHYLVSELESRLELGKLELRMGKTGEGRAVLAAVERDAASKQVLLISRKAAAALNSK
jgi:DNA-binding winged helix-turn-helix (wHTH) protein/tetratricopeptide (TPR) repeat protein